MKTILAAALAACVLAVPCLGSAPGDVETSFDSARLRDDLSGAIADPAKEARFTFHVSAGSKLSAKLAAEGAPGAAGLSLVLCDPAGLDQNVAGSPYDKSAAGSGVISWKKVPLGATGPWTLVVRASGAGAFRLTLSGALAALKHKFESPADLAVAAQTEVEFEGLRGGSLAYAFSPAKGSRFRGELVAIRRPDLTLLDVETGLAKGRVTLDADGTHALVFRNAGSGIGGWKAKANVTPPALLVRRGFVSAAGTAFVPRVTKLTPPSAFHRDDAARVTLTGRDLQPGADVRLVRQGFADILGTGTEWISETRIDCTFDLDTAPDTGGTSIGTWQVGVWNAPQYAVPDDRATLVKTSETRHQRKTFAALSALSITLPQGVVKDTEVWQLEFNEDFQTDLNRMGFGAGDGEIERLARDAVQAYVVCYLRELFGANETNGKVPKNGAPAVSFVVGDVPSVAGKPGEDYNRIEIGGVWQAGDEHDAAEPLFWGSAPLDPGNAGRDDLSIVVPDGLGGTVRVGRGVRTRVLDPGGSVVNQTFADAMQKLRQTPLTSNDRRYFLRSYAPTTVADANRYRDIVRQVSRAAREIAALVAHQVGRAMGLPAGGAGPMANPDTAGNFWPENGGLAFNAADLQTLTANASPALLPGKSAELVVGYFPLIATQPSRLTAATAAVDYAATWGFVGGRANAVPSEYTIRLQDSLDYGGTLIPARGTLTATFEGLSMTATPVYLDSAAGLPYGGILFLRLTATDDLRGDARAFLYRVDVMPNFAMLPASGVVLQRANTLRMYVQNN